MSDKSPVRKRLEALGRRALFLGLGRPRPANRAYPHLAESAGLKVTVREDLTPDFARHVQMYLDAVKSGHRTAIVTGYGQQMYDEVEQGLTMPSQFGVDARIELLSLETGKRVELDRRDETGVADAQVGWGAISHARQDARSLSSR